MYSNFTEVMEEGNLVVILNLLLTLLFTPITSTKQLRFAQLLCVPDVYSNSTDVMEEGNLVLDREEDVSTDRHAPKHDLYFASTQMQVRHEELDAKEQQHRDLSTKISNLQTFKNDTRPTLLASSSIRAPKKQNKPKTKVTKSKIKSMNELVRSSFNSNKLSYFSNQSKIDNFLSRINRVEDLSTFKESQNSNLYSKHEWTYILKSIKLKFPDLSAHNKTNLKRITKKINTFENEIANDGSIWSQASSHPETQLTDEEIRWLYDLSDDQMMNNSSFIDEDSCQDSNYVMILSQNQGELVDENDVDRVDGDGLFKEDSPNQSRGGLVSQELSCNREIREQSQELDPNPLETASQELDPNPLQPASQDQTLEVSLDDSYSNPNQNGLLSQKSHYEVVLDSEPEVEELEKSSIFQVVDLKESNTLDMPSHQKQILDPLISFQSFPFADTLSKTLQKGSELVYETINSSADNSPIKRNQILPIELTSISSNEEEEEEEEKHNITNVDYIARQHMTSETNGNISSPVQPSQISSPFKTPTKKSKSLLELIGLNAVNRISPFKIIPRSFEEKVAEEIIISSGDESVYSTAKSLFPPDTLEVYDFDDEPIPSSIPIRPPQKRRKLLQTTRYEIRNIQINDYVDEKNKFKVKRVGTRTITVDSENEIADSEEDEEDFSIIEITRELSDDTEDLIALGNEYDTESLIARNEYDPEDLNTTVKEDHDYNTSILQVPSSPDNLADGILRYGASPENRTEREHTADIEDIADITSEYTPHSQSRSQGILGLIPDASSDNNTSQMIFQSFELAKKPSQTFNFTNQTTKELKKLFQEWDLKPVKGRDKMIKILTETSRLFVDSQVIKSPVKSQNGPSQTVIIRGEMYNKLNELIKSNTFWYDKILSFEPLKLDQLQLWLESIGFNLEPDILQRYCDEQGICCINQK